MTQYPKAQLFQRDCGILMHPTSLPNDYGVGDFGPCAHAWIELLASHGQNLWQILPLNPAGYGDSPYQGLSAFAANPVFLSPEYIHQLGLISSEALSLLKMPRASAIDYAKVYQNKLKLSSWAQEAFSNLSESDPLRAGYEAFLEVESYWIEDFAMYAAIKSRFGGVAWSEWPAPFRDRQADALREVECELADAIERTKLEQFLLCRQWEDIRETALKRGVRIIGDLPIFIAHDSVDVWRQPELFRLKANGQPEAMAGVPPDYFSQTGQLWGNPLYNWERHQADDFAWWRRRLRKIYSWVDIVRIDHFRGFDACWEIPGGAQTAEAGHWVKVPGEALFKAFVQDHGLPLPMIAEDLGVITPEVTALREKFFLPGLRILQFAFGNDPMKHTFAPEAYDEHCVAYTGTHDNDTVVGWFHSKPGTDSIRSSDEIETERAATLDYLGTDGSAIHQDLIRCLYRSDCAAALVPVQDILGLGTEARMNTPGKASGSWRWRLEGVDALLPALKKLAKLSRKTKRGVKPAAAARARKSMPSEIPLQAT